MLPPTRFLCSTRTDKLRVQKICILIGEAHTMAGSKPWLQNEWVQHSQHMLDSYHCLLGHHLIERAGGPAEQAERLFNSTFVVVSHGTQPDPLLNYANAVALRLWNISIPTLLETPSRMTAETMHRDERAKLLARTTRDGYVDDYRGVRITTDGQRFLIDRATVWNVSDHMGACVGQAATFNRWTNLEPA